MASTDPRIDHYIARSAEFARPILVRLRAAVHRAFPEVEETVKWGMPFFVRDGAILCHMAAFKGHCSFGLWKASSVLGERPGPQEGMGHFGRITSVAALPSDAEIGRLLRRAAALRKEAASVPAPRPKRKPAAAIPGDLGRALKRNARARAAFERFSPSKRREYVEWLEEAKREETRGRRLETAIEWIEQGRSRNWKYERG
jgi:uncharacterized protein YdeI (YjbR/CyaY-like superfamily)